MLGRSVFGIPRAQSPDFRAFDAAHNPRQSHAVAPQSLPWRLIKRRLTLALRRLGVSGGLFQRGVHAGMPARSFFGQT